MQAETQLDMAKQEAAIEDALVREDVSTLKTQLSATRRELQATALEVRSAYGKHANTEEALHTKEVEVQVLSRRLSSIDAEVGMLSARLQLALTQLSGNETAACGVTDAAASLANSVSLLEAYVVEHHQMQEEAQSASAEEIRQLQERISALEQEMATVEEHTRVSNSQLHTHTHTHIHTHTQRSIACTRPSVCTFLLESAHSELTLVLPCYRRR
jgi:chromosome segregation ATPase